jgi:hypothetical protein
MIRANARRSAKLMPKTKVAFVEPMERSPVPKLPEGSQWVWEILCGPPHKISSVAFDVMWRWRCTAS